MSLKTAPPEARELEALPTGVQARIRASFPALSDAERLVGRFVEASPEEAIRLPIKRLAARIGVSEASIIRFSRAIGYQGIRDLKLALAAESAAPLQAIHQDIQPADSILAMAQKVLRSDMEAIADTLAMLDGAALERAVTAILEASRIECYGIGSSMPIALDAYYRFSRIGLPATILTDPHMQCVSAAQLPPGAVAFAISHTGRTVETLNALHMAKGSGATCIVLSSYTQTPLGRIADIELIAGARETAFRADAVASRLAHLSIIDALYVAVAMRRFDSSVFSLERANEIVEAHRLGERVRDTSLRLLLHSEE
jgi:RpiR family carbohydrate utilization transcriptional regulator